MTAVLDQIKQTVKHHNLVPFTASDITCTKEGDKAYISVVANGQRFSVEKPGDIMSTIGVKPSLTKRILSNPSENWSVFQNAIRNIDKNKTYGMIANERNEAVSIVDTKAREIQQINFDDRIDNLIDTISEIDMYQFQGAVFNPTNCSVDININNLSSELDMGQGDLWKFGTSVGISLTNQTYAQYFLRLICTNGMTTRENIGYRSADLTKHIGKQFTNYASRTATVQAARIRVDALKNARASVFELNSVANALGKDAGLYIPNYDQIAAEFREAGYNLKDVSAKQSRMMFTNENLYDVFNVATFLASHKRDEIGSNRALELNRVAGEMFTKGPNLRFSPIDIYKK